MENEVLDKTRELVLLAKDGDETALDRLYRAHAERIRRIVRFRMGPELRSKLESMDLVQDVLMLALRDLDGFTYSSEGDFLRWLTGIAENQIRGNLDKLHAAKRDIRREVSLERRQRGAESSPKSSCIPMVTTTPSVVFTRREELDRLERALDKLKGEHRQVILLAKIEGLSYQHIGQRLNRSPDAVGMLLSRAMLALIKAFERI